VPFWTFPAGGSLGTLGLAIILIGVLYLSVMLLMAGYFYHRPGGSNELLMLEKVARTLAVFFGVIVTARIAGWLPKSWAAMAGFVGLLLGWSLQAPVSGVAAWLLISLKRPFRIGDRVKLEDWDLRGDIAHIGLMYTQLNQVGGTVGSEDLAGRTILIPNSMLFQNIVVNYTPRQASAFVLDEVTIRMTYNSNWQTAERILLRAAEEVTENIIKTTGVQPYVRADMYEYGIKLFLRYMTPATDRPRIVYELTKKIVEAFSQSPDVDFALPYVFSQRTGMQMRHQPRGKSPIISSSLSPAPENYGDLLCQTEGV